MSPPPRIIRDDDGLLVVDKPAGLPSTGKDLDDPRSVQAWLQKTLGRDKIWAVHQLDQETSGLNLFVKRKALVSVWAERLRLGTKTYLAIVHGGPDASFVRDATLVIDAPIGTRRSGVKHFPAITTEGDPAATDVVIVATTPEGAIVMARPRTGRTHQVRLHLAHIGHPVFGERLHCDPPCDEHPRHALHAWRMELASCPTLEAPIPADLRALAERLGLALPAASETA